MFFEIELDTYVESLASPKVDVDTFEGIKIAMPAKIVLSEKETIPLCGVWILPESTGDRFGDLDENLIYLIRDVNTHESFTGHFRHHVDPANPADLEEEEPESISDADEPPDSDEEQELMQGWFNFDLARVWKTPEKAARYRLQVIFGNVRSNSLEFEVKP